jgi:hypothetical protein
MRVAKNMRDRPEQMEFNPPLPHLDHRRLLGPRAEQRWLGVERFEIAADRDRLGNDRAVIELKGRHPLQWIDRGVGGRLVRQFAQIDLLGRHRDPLFRQEDLDPAGIGRPAPVIELHLSPFVNPGILSRA